MFDDQTEGFKGPTHAWGKYVEAEREIRGIVGVVDREFVESIVGWKHRIDAEIETLSLESGDEREDNYDGKKPIWDALFEVNNSLVELFWQIMIYREGHGLPVPVPHSSQG